MSISKVFSAQLSGLDTHIITIEVDLSHGLHAFSIVGLADKAVEEARDRISAAIKNSGYTSPKQKNQKVVISLAPADIRKEGPSFDVGMAIAYLLASGDVDFDSSSCIFLGELSLEGTLRRVNGILPLVRGSKNMGFKNIFVPKENAEEAGLVKDITIYPARSLSEILNHFSRVKRIVLSPQKPTEIKDGEMVIENDFSIIRGQEPAKRALEIAASGGHNIGMYGPPGTGKTMLAKAFQGILPPLDYDEILEVTGIHSISKKLNGSFITQPPFRSPHHTASYTSLVGGGAFPKPGEITLAHRGVLFLDEFPEFDKRVIESLRQPLEEHCITISRARGTLTFPAQCIVIASMNPCPCGYGMNAGCTCSTKNRAAYSKKISGPIVDRIDMWISVSKIEYGVLSEQGYSAESSSEIRKRVIESRKTQLNRFKKHTIEGKKFNSQMGISDIEKCISLKNDVRNLLKESTERLGLSARAYHRIIKLTQTIADLDGDMEIKESHVLEALRFRQKIF
jgi:magnesium chelatase family protein